MKLRPFIQITLGIGLCAAISGCNSIYNSEYYIPVDNQMGDAQPLSKNDVIRVVITHNYLDIPPSRQSGLMNWGYLQQQNEKQKNVYKI